MSPTKHKARFTIPSDEMFLPGREIRLPAGTYVGAVRKDDRPTVSGQLLGMAIVAITAGVVGFVLGLGVAAVFMG